MPASTIAGASASATDAVMAAYKAMAERMHDMSAAADTNATSYEGADTAFASQLQEYRDGVE